MSELDDEYFELRDKIIKPKLLQLVEEYKKQGYDCHITTKPQIRSQKSKAIRTQRGNPVTRFTKGQISIVRSRDGCQIIVTICRQDDVPEIRVVRIRGRSTTTITTIPFEKVTPESVEQAVRSEFG